MADRQTQIEELSQLAEKISELIQDNRLNPNAIIPMAQVLASVRQAQYTAELTVSVKEISEPLKELRDKITKLNVTSLLSLASMFKSGV